MHVTPRAHLVSLTIAILSTSCATQPYQTYPGPKLPRAETANIAANHASIISIDGAEFPDGPTFMLRAGIHAVSATGIDANGYSIGLMTLCLAAEGGANYQVRLGGSARERPEVYDLDRGSVVRTLLVPIGQDCAAPPPGSTAVAVLVTSGGRVHRGRTPPPTLYERHVENGSSDSPPFDPGMRLLIEIPVRILLGLLFCLRK